MHVLLFVLAMIMTSTNAIWNEITQCRDVKKKRRGYRAGFMDPKEMLHSKKFWSADDMMRGSIENRGELPAIEMYELTNFMYRAR